MSALALLRPGLLAGRTVLAAPDGARCGACAELGARVVAIGADPLDEEAVARAVEPGDALVVDASRAFGAGGPEALRAALDTTWSYVRAAANGAFIGHRDEARVVLVAPRPDAGPFAVALRDGLENLARVTSIEWSRHRITPTALLPGPETRDDEVAQLVAYLVSPAGGYFSGCAFTLT